MNSNPRRASQAKGLTKLDSLRLVRTFRSGYSCRAAIRNELLKELRGL